MTNQRVVVKRARMPQSLRRGVRLWRVGEPGRVYMEALERRLLFSSTPQLGSGPLPEWWLAGGSTQLTASLAQQGILFTPASTTPASPQPTELTISFTGEATEKSLFGLTATLSKPDGRAFTWGSTAETFLAPPTHATSASAQLTVAVPVPRPTTGGGIDYPLGGVCITSTGGTLLWGSRDPNPTGTVTFLDGSTVLGTATLGSSGGATLWLSHPLSYGSHTITATYSGDSNYIAATSQSSTLFVPHGTTRVDLSSSASSVAQGSRFTLTATVTTTENQYYAPTGNVTFWDGSQVLGTVPLGSQGASVTVDLTQGEHSFTAAYCGDDDYASSVSQPLAQQVTAPVPAQPSFPIYGHSSTTIATFPITVTFPTTAMSPQATELTVSFTGDPTEESPLDLTATLSKPDGSAFWWGQSAQTFPALPTQATSASAQLTVAIPAPLPANYGNGILVLAGGATIQSWSLPLNSTSMSGTISSVLWASGGFVDDPNPTGTVTFLDGSTVLGTATLDSSGEAELHLSQALSYGSHTITATYSGDNDYAAATSQSGSLFVTHGTTVVDLSSSDSSVVQGSRVTLTATVSTTENQYDAPTGNIIFRDGDQVLDTVALNSGCASVTLDLAPGVHSLTASYSGSTEYQSSVSAPLPQLVTPLWPGNSTPRVLGIGGADTILGTIQYIPPVVTIGAAQGDPVANVLAPLIGGSGNNVLRGGAGDEIFYGASGNDGVVGAGGGDWLGGGAGEGALPGHGGNDTLLAGEGLDVFATVSRTDIL